jgi:hypothetical protein
MLKPQFYNLHHQQTSNQQLLVNLRIAKIVASNPHLKPLSWGNPPTPKLRTCGLVEMFDQGFEMRKMLLMKRGDPRYSSLSSFFISLFEIVFPSLTIFVLTNLTAAAAAWLRISAEERFSSDSVKTKE